MDTLWCTCIPWFLPCLVTGMSEAEILAQAMIFIFGGFDTTATTLSFLLHALTLNPDIQQTLFEEVHSKLAGQVMEKWFFFQKL